jgi:hypothetical protein
MFQLRFILRFKIQHHLSGNFLGLTARQDVKVCRRFGNYNRPYLQGVLMFW